MKANGNKTFEKIKEAILRLLFPPKCIICDGLLSSDGELCPQCLAIWESARRARCPVCNKTARACTCKTFHMMDTDPIGERGMTALVYYGKFGSEDIEDIAVLKLIYKVKTLPYKRPVRFCARELSAQILKAMMQSGESPQEYKITYPPRCRKRRIKYGFDHARNLAAAISEYTGIPLEETLENRGITAQKSLNALMRSINAKKAYSLKAGVRPSGKYILVDDIVTTGATLNSAALLLKSAGAERVFPACIARTKKKKHKLRRPSSRPWFKVK